MTSHDGGDPTNGESSSSGQAEVTIDIDDDKFYKHLYDGRRARAERKRQQSFSEKMHQAFRDGNREVLL